MLDDEDWKWLEPLQNDVAVERYSRAQIKVTTLNDKPHFYVMAGHDNVFPLSKVIMNPRLNRRVVYKDGNPCNNCKSNFVVMKVKMTQHREERLGYTKRCNGLFREYLKEWKNGNCKDS